MEVAFTVTTLALPSPQPRHARQHASADGWAMVDTCGERSGEQAWGRESAGTLLAKQHQEAAGQGHRQHSRRSPPRPQAAAPAARPATAPRTTMPSTAALRPMKQPCQELLAAASSGVGRMVVPSLLYRYCAVWMKRRGSRTIHALKGRSRLGVHGPTAAAAGAHGSGSSGRFPGGRPERQRRVRAAWGMQPGHGSQASSRGPLSQWAGCPGE